MLLESEFSKKVPHPIVYILIILCYVSARAMCPGGPSLDSTKMVIKRGKKNIQNNFFKDLYIRY
jgi:hypothetical protein